MKMIDHNHFICHLILGTFTEYPYLRKGFFNVSVGWIIVLILISILPCWCNTA